MQTDHVLANPSPTDEAKTKAAILHVLDEVERCINIQQTVLRGVLRGEVPSLGIVDLVAAHSRGPATQHLDCHGTSDSDGSAVGLGAVSGVASRTP